jgi:hypothetical protein
MKSVEIRCYEELNEHLPEDKRKRSFECRFEGNTTVADLLRALGIPLVEVDLVLCGSNPAGLDKVPRDGDRISLYPVFERLDLSGTTRVRDAPLRRPRFLVSRGLQGLCFYLRMLGFDTLTGERDEGAGRILLTLDAIPPGASHALRIREAGPRRQALEVIRRLDLGKSVAPFSHCPRCNQATAMTRAGRLCDTCARTYTRTATLRRLFSRDS